MAIRAAVNRELLDAATLEVRATHLEGGFLELAWHSGESPPALRKATRVHWNAALGELHESFRFDLGEIAGRRAGDTVVLRTRPDPSRRPCLREATWFVAALDPARLTEARQAGGRLLLGPELRDARLADEAAPLVVDLPDSVRAPRLSVVAGVWGQSTSPVSFSLELHSRDSSPLASSKFEISPGQSGQWIEHAIDLPATTEPGARLALRSTGCTAPDGAICLPAWSEVRLRPGPPGSAARAPDIVLISVDTLRADRMSLYGAPVETTPAIDAWARRNATVFDWAISAAGWTLPAHVSMLSGLDVVRHSVTTARKIPDAIPLGPELLRRSGYRTEAVVGGGYLDPRFGLHRGFDVYRSWRGATAGRNEIAFVVGAAIRALAVDDPRPLFLFVHTYEVHPPLRVRDGCPGITMAVERNEQLTVQELPVEERNERLEGSRWMIGETGSGGTRQPLAAERSELVAQLYDCGVWSMDRSIGNLLDAIERHRTTRPTLVVLTSDHGESFDEHGIAGHGLLYDDNLRVPLLISRSDRARAGARVSTQVRLVDVLPTLLAEAGIEAPDDLDGEPLDRAAAPKAPAIAYSDQLGLAIRAGNRMKFLFWDRVDDDRAARDRLFDLRSDPGETIDLLKSTRDRDAWIELATRSTSRLAGLALRIPPRPGLEHLELRADWLRPESVRWAAPPVEGVRFDDAGVLSIRGPIARPIELRATVAADEADAIELRGRWLDREADEFDLLEPLDFRTSALRRIELAPRTAGAGAAAGPRALLMVIERIGLASGGVRESVRDRDALEQLRALGYLQ